MEAGTKKKNLQLEYVGCDLVEVNLTDGIDGVVPSAALELHPSGSALFAGAFLGAVVLTESRRRQDRDQQPRH